MADRRREDSHRSHREGSQRPRRSDSPRYSDSSHQPGSARERGYPSTSSGQQFQSSSSGFYDPVSNTTRPQPEPPRTSRPYDPVRNGHHRDEGRSVVARDAYREPPRSSAAVPRPPYTSVGPVVPTHSSTGSLRLPPAMHQGTQPYPSGGSRQPYTSPYPGTGPRVSVPPAVLPSQVSSAGRRPLISIAPRPSQERTSTSHVGDYNLPARAYTERKAPKIRNTKFENLQGGVGSFGVWNPSEDSHVRSSKGPLSGVHVMGERAKTKAKYQDQPGTSARENYLSGKFTTIPFETPFVEGGRGSRRRPTASGTDQQGRPTTTQGQPSTQRPTASGSGQAGRERRSTPRRSPESDHDDLYADPSPSPPRRRH